VNHAVPIISPEDGDSMLPPTNPHGNLTQKNIIRINNFPLLYGSWIKDLYTVPFCLQDQSVFLSHQGWHHCMRLLCSCDLMMMNL
jgi:hypothetical protein